jgi:UDPglucose 6-dehydrogenase
MKVGFVGASHLGQVYSAATAAAGIEVTVIDPDESLISTLRATPSVAEPGLDDAWRTTRNIRTCSTDIQKSRDCDLVFISKDVPTDDRGESHEEVIELLAHDVFAALRGSETPVVLLSQVTPGTTRRLASEYELLSYQVETLVVGQALSGASHPERHIVGVANVTVGLHPRHAEWLDSFPAAKHVMTYESAELSKIAINLFLAASVSTTNSIAELARSLGASWDDIVPTLRTDRRIGPHAYLTPGLGLSGGNIERDLATFLRLADAGRADPSVIEAFVRSSKYHRDWTLRQLATVDLPSRAVVAVLGIAYKADTASTKNSPALEVLDALVDCEIRVHDPHAVLDERHSQIRQTENWREAVTGADCLIVMTPWAEYVSIDVDDILELMHGTTIIDPNRVLSRSDWKAAGYDYRSLRGTEIT